MISTTTISLKDGRAIRLEIETNVLSFRFAVDAPFVRVETDEHFRELDRLCRDAPDLERVRLQWLVARLEHK